MFNYLFLHTKISCLSCRYISISILKHKEHKALLHVLISKKEIVWHKSSYPFGHPPPQGSQTHT